MTPLPSHPILTCDAARDFEEGRFGGDEAREWPAMQAAGRALATAVRRDFAEIGSWPAAPRLLVLAGKGHNGGDALIAARELLAATTAATADVLFPFGSRRLRPLAARAWRELTEQGGGRVRTVAAPEGAYDLSLDGVFGFQFRPPVGPAVAGCFESVNRHPIRLRAAVDLPSADLCAADFTYATGIVKAPLLASPVAGRIRYLDLGFFDGFGADGIPAERVLLASVLAPLAGWRSPASDKRTHGHLFVVGGSTDFPGAVLMAVLAALRSGVGLVTAFVPEPLVPAFAARAPEAMWVGWPLTPAGGLALEGEHLLRRKLERATALALGPGLGREPETLALVRSLVERSSVPLVLDADALQPDIVVAGQAPRIVTPHAGELARIGGRSAQRADTVVVEKGPLTRIVAGGVGYVSPFGGPVLARGGSGDLLAGLVGGLLAQTPEDPRLAAARGVVWHGRAADALARSRGAVAVAVTDLLGFLPGALREE
jgi:hydroxyethylthiazole kinase-like uncharacterized protein yjeF